MRQLFFVVCLGVFVAQATPAAARAPRRAAAVKPKLYLVVEKVSIVPGQPAALLPRVKRTLEGALRSSPLVVTQLALGRVTPATVRLALRRRRLSAYGVSLRLDRVTHELTTDGAGKQLKASATVTLTGLRRERFRKGSFEVKGEGRIALPISVVLHGEVLAARIAAVDQAVSNAVRLAVAQLTAPRRRRRR